MEGVLIMSTYDIQKTMLQLRKILPEMEVGEDNDGQIIIYTNLQAKENNDGSQYLVTME